MEINSFSATKPNGIITVRCSDISTGKYIFSTKPTPDPNNPDVVTTIIPERLSYIVEQITKRPGTSSVSLLNVLEIQMTTEKVTTTTETTKDKTTNSTEAPDNVEIKKNSTSTTSTTTQKIITSTTDLNLKVQTVSGCFGDIVHFHCNVGFINTCYKH